MVQATWMAVGPVRRSEVDDARLKVEVAMAFLARMVLLCLMLLPGAVAAAAEVGMSIDCATSKEPFAPAVCNSRYLRALDAHMTGLYKDLATTRNGAQLQELKAAQARWWKRRGTCASGVDPETCAEMQLVDQIALLRHFREVPVLEHLPPVSDEEYDRLLLLYDGDIAAILKKISPVSSTATIRASIETFLRSSKNNTIGLEAIIRALCLRIIEGNYFRALASFESIESKIDLRTIPDNQQARFLLLKTIAQMNAYGFAGKAESYWSDYCRLGVSCNRNMLGDESAAIEYVLTLGTPAKYRREILSKSLLPEVRRGAEVAKAQFAAEENAARAAADREQQLKIDADNAAREAAEAAERAAKEEAARQLRHTFRYQAALIGRSILESLTFIWVFFPVWSYPVAATIALLVHRHVALRITIGLASLAGLGCYALYTSSLQPTLPASPTAFLTTVWRTWAAYNPDMAPGRLVLNLVLTYALLLGLAYILTLILVGREVRSAEAYRLRGFVPEWVRGWRYAFSQRWAERAEMKRQLRHARHEAKITALQVRAQQPQQLAYAYPPPGGAGGAVRSFFDFTRATVSLVKWGMIAVSIFVVVRFGEGIIDKLSSLIEKTMTLIERLPAFLK